MISSPQGSSQCGAIMGASGVRLLDDDLAADVRELFRERLQRGTSGTTASKELISQFEEVIGTDEESVFWLALAYVQWEYGLLQKRILKKAQKVIDSGSDLKRWADVPKLQRQRARVLDRLRHHLASPNPRPKAVCPRKRLPRKCEWQSGDVFAFHMPSAHVLLLRVIAVPDNVGDDLPVCELLDWVGANIPNEDVIINLPIRRNKRYPSESAFTFPMLKKYLARCQSLGIRTPTVLKDDGGYVLPIDFKELPQALKEHFGMSVDAFEPQSGAGGQ